MKQPNETLYHGPNIDGVDVVLISDVGGNNKTEGTIGLAIVPLETFQATKEAERQAIEEGVEPRKIPARRTQGYYKSIRNTIETSCGKCLFGAFGSKALASMGFKPCYAQHNYQNATQPSAILGRASDVLPEYGVFQLDAYRKLRGYAQYMGITKVRSAVVGDLGMIPAHIATALIDASVGLEWLGYTHQWFRSEHLKSTHQASTQGPWKAAQAAIDRGWAIYHVVSGKETTVDPRFTLCPAQQGKLAGIKVTCAGCPVQCNGKDANLTYAIDHGPGSQIKRTLAGMVALENLTIAA